MAMSSAPGTSSPRAACLASSTRRESATTRSQSTTTRSRVTRHAARHGVVKKQRNAHTHQRIAPRRFAWHPAFSQARGVVKNVRPRTYLIGHADEILKPRPQLAVPDVRAAETQRADAARQQHRGKRHAFARRLREQGRCLRDLGEPVEYARAGKKRMIAGGNYRAENDGIHKGCGGGCRNEI